jgi:hypothetical protein
LFWVAQRFQRCDNALFLKAALQFAEKLKFRIRVSL